MNRLAEVRTASYGAVIASSCNESETAYESYFRQIRIIGHEMGIGPQVSMSRSLISSCGGIDPWRSTRWPPIRYAFESRMNLGCIDSDFKAFTKQADSSTECSNTGVDRSESAGLLSAG